MPYNAGEVAQRRGGGLATATSAANPLKNASRAAGRPRNQEARTPSKDRQKMLCNAGEVAQRRGGGGQQEGAERGGGGGADAVDRRGARGAPVGAQHREKNSKACPATGEARWWSQEGGGVPRNKKQPAAGGAGGACQSGRSAAWSGRYSATSGGCRECTSGGGADGVGATAVAGACHCLGPGPELMSGPFRVGGQTAFSARLGRACQWEIRSTAGRHGAVSGGTLSVLRC